jgi:hypothetical protein
MPLQNCDELEPSFEEKHVSKYSKTDLKYRNGVIAVENFLNGPIP